MIGRKRFILWGILFSLFMLHEPAFGQKLSDPFSPSASSYLVKVNRKIVWGKNIHERLPPASLTKVMTALIAIERANLNAVVKVGKSVERERGSRIGLKPDDRVRVIDLLYATLIYSANDACRALAEYIGGSEANFVRIMNLKAKRLGLRDTHFANACGHDHPNHYSSAYDLAVLTEFAMRKPIFAKIVSIPSVYIRTVDGKKVFKLVNRNKLLGDYPGVSGVKTGYTRKAGNCLIAWAQGRGRRVLLVLLNAPNRWEDARILLDKAFSL
ncbi:MAG: D-alanyl-D-alanine carboxypeptidase [Synergistetes bacterium]|nr:MAG: Serine-type D-Ala-D-Ala carboxypeptidase [bacterium 42_11]MBC7331049.1 D-alanyl-D-alanine carboxypeptidase [Synergistota bacterium]MDK2871805.1 hypothetical protein [bacterium]